MSTRAELLTLANPRLIAALLLVLLTLVVYWPVRNAAFVLYDDADYVTDNIHVAGGLTRESVRWAFAATRASTWQPLVWLSYMLDVELYGVRNASGFHLTNLALHMANVVLLFLLLARIGAGVRPALFVAAVFAVHPVHVESVAWVAERKDVLSTLFWLLATASYARYAQTRTPLRYLTTMLLFALGLMAKPMLVTLPFTLLLLDFWPLRRLASEDGRFPWRRLAALAAEKAPLFVLAAASAAWTYVVQREGGAVSTFRYLPIEFRLCNVAISYGKYLASAVWPAGLAVLYPYPVKIPLWQVAASAGLLAAVSLVTWRQARRFPWLFVGWFWFVGTLVPVIGIVRIGEHAMADRFAYVPLIGIYVAVAWGVPRLLARWRPELQRALPVAAAAALAALGVLAHRQVGYWRDSASLFTRAVQVTRGNFVMHNNIGVLLLNQGRRAEAAAHFAEALKARPDYAISRCNWGRVLELEGALEAAEAAYREAYRADPRNVQVNYHLGNVAVRKRDYPAAMAYYRAALAADEELPEVHLNLGYVLSELGRNREALDHYRLALRYKPEFAAAYHNMGILMETVKRPQEAIACYAAALRIRPDLPDTHYNLANALAEAGQTDEALVHYREAIRLDPSSARALTNLGNLLIRTGRTEEGIEQYRKALGADPSYAPARENLSRLAPATVPQPPALSNAPAPTPDALQ